eukprot:520656_1
MTTFKEVFGPKLGQMMEQYWPYTFLIVSVYVILYQIGIGKLIYNLLKQAVIMIVMLLCGTVWYILMTQHVTTLTSSFDTTALLAAIHEAMNGNASQVVSDSKIMEPLTEILVISGATMFLLGVLYRQLPIDLIPDCIPCIGKYDNMMAGLCAFCGFIIFLVGIYCQLNYSNGANSASSVVQLLKNGTNFISSAEGFLQNNDDKKWDNLNISTQYLFERATEITSQSYLS